MDVRPKRRIRDAWFLRLPGFVVGWACINRGHWLLYDTPEALADPSDTWWVATFGITFAAIGVVNLAWHTSAPWRLRSGAPFVALATSLTYGIYAVAVILALGPTAVRATALDLLALGLLIAFTWGPNQDEAERLDDA